jgi:hypothetical protein
MSNEQQVATERIVVANPAMNDPNAGIIVAAGDPIPAGVGIISNTPNKVDAAANYDEADAADRAGAGATPATIVVRQGEGPSAEILERVAENRNSWEQESQLLGRQASSPAGPDASTSTDDGTPFDPAKATGKDLDARYAGVEGYPKSGKVADRQAWAAKYEADAAKAVETPAPPAEDGQ